MQQEKCPFCGKNEMKLVSGTFHFEAPADNSRLDAGDKSIDVPNAEWKECGECKERIIPHELNVELERWQYKREGLLTPEELKSIRESTGLTQVEIGRALKVGDKTYQRWENGTSMQTKAMDNLIRIFAKDPAAYMDTDCEREQYFAVREKVSRYLHSLEKREGKNPLPIAAHGGPKNKEGKTAVIEFIRGKLNGGVSGNE